MNHLKSRLGKIAAVLMTLALGHESLSVARASSTSMDLKLVAAGRSQVVGLAELRKKLKETTITVEDPVFKKRKTYEGFLLADVLKAVGFGEIEGDEIVFHCADGYAPTLSFAKLKEQKALLAFRDKTARTGSWDRLKQGKAWITPAPYYLVWESGSESLPWPYQVVGLEIIRFKEKYAKIFPEGVPSGSPVYLGFDQFRGKCLKCHSLNLEGGVLGPELNVPKNITEYWDEKVLAQFIRNPGEFRARSKMPAFPELKDEELRALLEYLKWMKDHKQP